MPVMGLRLATVSDIEAMHAIRLAVTENRLTDPSRVTTEKYQKMLGQRGRGWVMEDDAGGIAGFGIADALSRSFWALFVHPGRQRRGVGRALHDAMVSWLFAIDDRPIWLTTEPDTRAAGFYAAAGWLPQHSPVPGELCFARFIPGNGANPGTSSLRCRPR
ncbi:MAG: GNAT family N-acetyltransferase [Gammaproteobacteria bacterium]